MWNIDPAVMCNRHLLGEHAELHMMVGAIRKGRSIAGHVARGQVDPRAIALRHALVVDEMKERGFRHSSPLGRFRMPKVEGCGISSLACFNELARRCSNCRGLQILWNYRRR